MALIVEVQPLEYARGLIEGLKARGATRSCWPPRPSPTRSSTTSTCSTRASWSTAGRTAGDVEKTKPRARTSWPRRSRRPAAATPCCSATPRGTASRPSGPGVPVVGVLTGRLQRAGAARRGRGVRVRLAERAARRARGTRRWAAEPSRPHPSSVGGPRYELPTPREAAARRRRGRARGPTRAEQDRRLLIRYHRHGDQAAREELVQRLLPLARRMARRYRRSDEPLDDLVQVATLGLIKAIDRFDPARETAFSSYAVPTMLGELKRYFRDNGWAVHVPRGMQERVMQVDNCVKDMSRKLGRSPSVAEVGAHARPRRRAGARGDGGGVGLRRGVAGVLPLRRRGRRRDLRRVDRRRGRPLRARRVRRHDRADAAGAARRATGSCCTCASSRTSRRPRSPSASASPRCTSHG